METPDFESMVNTASSDAEKGAERVARAFYRVLRKNGFTEKQIINIAANLISCLNDSLKGYRKKVEEGHSGGDEEPEGPSKFSRHSLKKRPRGNP